MYIPVIPFDRIITLATNIGPRTSLISCDSLITLVEANVIRLSGDQVYISQKVDLI